MGYSTDFVGAFKFSKTLTQVQREYLLKFSDTRRVKRDAEKAVKLGDITRIAAGLMDVGVEGGYFTGGLGFAGQDDDESVVDGNNPPEGQPGLWCQWEPSESGDYLGWNGGEKFYHYVEWLQYIITHFLTPWGITITGVVRWRGESSGDKGSIVVTDNVIDVRKGEKVRMTHNRHFKNETCLGWSVPAKPARA